jgi:hypothetical protein
LQSFSRLPNLIRFRTAILRLQVDFIPQIGAAKEMVTAGNPHFKSKPLQQVAKLVKIPTLVALKIAQSFQ